MKTSEPTPAKKCKVDVAEEAAREGPQRAVPEIVMARVVDPTHVVVVLVMMALPEKAQGDEDLRDVEGFKNGAAQKDDQAEGSTFLPIQNMYSIVLMKTKTANSVARNS